MPYACGIDVFQPIGKLPMVERFTGNHLKVVEASFNFNTHKHFPMLTRQPSAP